MYIVGSQLENELILVTVLGALYETLTSVLTAKPRQADAPR